MSNFRNKVIFTSKKCACFKILVALLSHIDPDFVSFLKKEAILQILDKPIPCIIIKRQWRAR